MRGTHRPRASCTKIRIILFNVRQLKNPAATILQNALADNGFRNTLFILRCVKGIFPGPSFAQTLLNMRRRLEVKVPKLVQRFKRPVGRLIVSAQLERHRQVAPAGLHRKVVGRLVVELVLDRKPDLTALILEAAQDAPVGPLIVPSVHQRTYFLSARLMAEFLFHIGGGAVPFFFHVPADAPFSFHRVRAFQQRHAGAS